jgi:RNA polymerase sigma-70 factor (ECF subfamily)
VATLTRLLGDLEAAEDAVQDACALAVTKWAAEGVPSNPGSWLIGVARHKALDRVRREVRRREKEAAATRAASRLDIDRNPNGDGEPGDEGWGSLPDDELGLIFLCCHPSLDPAVRVALTLRSVCGLATDEIAAAFLVPEPTMAQRLVRAKRKIRQAGISFGIPGPDDLAARLGSVLRVVYLVFTQGHLAAGGQELVKGGLCDQAVRLARALAALMPQEPEAAGLLALLLLTDARRGARSRDTGDIILLEDQDRGRWDPAMIAEGEALLEQALRGGRPGPYQLHAAIAACHSCAPAAADTDWREIAALYGELIRYEPTAVVEANRAVAVAMAEGPEAGLVILDAVGAHPQMGHWPQYHIARAELLRRVGRFAEATEAYRAALRLEPAVPEQDFIGQRLRQLGGAG